MHADDWKFAGKKKYSHKRKGERHEEEECFLMNISEKKPTHISPAAPTKAEAAGAGLGKPLLWAAMKHVCSLVIEHVLKYVH